VINLVLGDPKILNGLGERYVTNYRLLAQQEPQSPFGRLNFGRSPVPVPDFSVFRSPVTRVGKGEGVPSPKKAKTDRSGGPMRGALALSSPSQRNSGARELSPMSPLRTSSFGHLQFSPESPTATGGFKLHGSPGVDRSAYLMRRMAAASGHSPISRGGLSFRQRQLHRQQSESVIPNMFATPVLSEGGSPLEVNIEMSNLAKLGEGEHMTVYSLEDDPTVVYKTWQRALNSGVSELRRKSKVQQIMLEAYKLVGYMQEAGVPVVPILNSQADMVRNWRVVAPRKSGNTYAEASPEAQVELVVSTLEKVFIAQAKPQLPYFHPDILPENFELETGALMDTIDRFVDAPAEDELLEKLFLHLDQPKERNGGFGLPFTSNHYDRLVAAIRSTLAVLEPSHTELVGRESLEQREASAQGSIFYTPQRTEAQEFLVSKYQKLTKLVERFAGRAREKRQAEQKAQEAQAARVE